MPSVVKRFRGAEETPAKTSPRSRGRSASPKTGREESVPRPQVNGWLNGSARNDNESGINNATTQHNGNQSSLHNGKSTFTDSKLSPEKTIGSGFNLSARGWKSPSLDGPVHVSSPGNVTNGFDSPKFSLPSKGPGIGAPRIRYNRTPIRFAVSGDWALKECEELTTWANDLLKKDGQKHITPILDLRKSVGDGTTLVSITEKVCRGPVTGIERDITCKEDRVHNIENCLEKLQTIGVNAAGIDAEDLADGNLKSALLLVGNIRKNFESSGDSTSKGDDITEKPATENKQKSRLSMPGVPLPGPHQPQSTETVRKTYFTSAEELLPGVLNKEEVKYKPSHSGNLISMTELGINGASQHGVEERRQQIPPNKGPRPLSAGSRPAPPGPKPVLTGPTMPGSTTNAWAEGSRPQGTVRPSTLSVEDRLKSLINSNPTRDTKTPNPPRKLSLFTRRVSPVTNLHRASRSFDDGELLLPPPPQTRSNDLGYPSTQRYHTAKSGQFNNAYVPSQPDERWQGSRSEAILDRQNPPPPYRPPPGGKENAAFTHELDAVHNTNSVKPGQNGSELRNAWNKLYGRPPSRGVTPTPNHPYQQLQQVKLPATTSHTENMSPVMSARFHPSQPTVASRTSPMGQSSSTGGHGSNSSSGINVDTGALSFETFGKTSPLNQTPNLSPTSPTSPQSLTLGPSSKYPDYGSRPSSARNKPINQQKLSDDWKEGQININSRKNMTADRSLANPYSVGKIISGGSKYGYNTGTLDSETSGGLENQASIFDYVTVSEASSRSVTPPLPPLSPSNSGSDFSSPEVSPRLPRSSSATMLYTPKTPDLLSNTVNDDRRGRRGQSSQGKFRPDKRHHKHSLSQGHNGHFNGILSDVRESGNDSDEPPPFDIENTILTVESQDTDMLTMHEGLASQDLHVMRDKMNNLESMYGDLMQALGVDKEVGVANGAVMHGGPPRRRWSIGSSDTSSLRRPIKQKPPRGPGGNHRHHHYSHRDIKAINRRFQRLESHVVTLARSVAHLSSELRMHNAVSHDLESLRKDLQEMKEQQFINSHKATYSPNDLTDVERFRGWVPSMTNPKRVHKLTKFFGQEPPLLQFFLKKLGYEKYASNFENEHIGMIELPYMTEDRLEKIGIPMGPRLRIIQEAQLCFRQENFNIYIV